MPQVSEAARHEGGYFLVARAPHLAGVALPVGCDHIVDLLAIRPTIFHKPDGIPVYVEMHRSFGPKGR
eukprot:2512744-Pyramimonas_sp.AAC.1